MSQLEPRANCEFPDIYWTRSGPSDWLILSTSRIIYVYTLFVIPSRVKSYRCHATIFRVHWGLVILWAYDYQFGVSLHRGLGCCFRIVWPDSGIWGWSCTWEWGRGRSQSPCRTWVRVRRRVVPLSSSRTSSSWWGTCSWALGVLLSTNPWGGGLVGWGSICIVYVLYILWLQGLLQQG
jgi:hypothetical protein